MITRLVEETSLCVGGMWDPVPPQGSKPAISSSAALSPLALTRL